MKRLIARRKLNRKCIYCNQKFIKGDIYYKQRLISTEQADEYSEKDKIYTCEYLMCPKCKYQYDSRNKREKDFLSVCHHPITEEIWTYMAGECVKEPYGVKCLICNQWI